jgi:hypothetical protein
MSSGMEDPTSLEEFVRMTAMIHMTNKDFEGMYAHFGIDEDTWHGIVAHWMGRIAADQDLAHQFRSLMRAELSPAQPTAG